MCYTQIATTRQLRGIGLTPSVRKHILSAANSFGTADSFLCRFQRRLVAPSSSQGYLPKMKLCLFGAIEAAIKSTFLISLWAAIRRAPDGHKKTPKYSETGALFVQRVLAQSLRFPSLLARSPSCNELESYFTAHLYHELCEMAPVVVVVGLPRRSNFPIVTGARNSEQNTQVPRAKPNQHASKRRVSHDCLFMHYKPFLIKQTCTTNAPQSRSNLRKKSSLVKSQAARGIYFVCRLKFILEIRKYTMRADTLRSQRPPISIRNIPTWTQVE